MSEKPDWGQSRLDLELLFTRVQRGETTLALELQLVDCAERLERGADICAYPVVLLDRAREARSLSTLVRRRRAGKGPR